MTRWLPVAALLLAACSPAPFAKTPPAKYQKPGVYLVRTHPTESMPTVCAGASTVGEPPGPIVGCFRNGVIEMPNPCEWPDNPWGEIFCHEAGHAQGWPANHPDS